MDRQELILEYQRSINDIYKEHGLTSIRGLDDKYEINGRQVIMWHSKATHKFAKRNQQFNYFKNFDDILFCSDELLYFTAHLYLYRPYINNPTEEGFPFSGGMVYPNYQNLEAKRYSMFSDVTSQKAYNYWDRIGDLIASFFPEKLKAHNVFFSTAVQSIPSDYHTSENYLWLKAFKEDGYVELNKIRKQIVHNTTSDTDFKHKHLERISNKNGMQALQSERENIADFYKNHISLTLTGFEKTLLFIEEINTLQFIDEE
jgi:hypothetical protein